MFICDNCLKENYENTPEFWIPRSYGNCECCGETKSCSDIYSGNLVPKVTGKEGMTFKSQEDV